MAGSVMRRSAPPTGVAGLLRWIGGRSPEYAEVPLLLLAIRRAVEQRNLQRQFPVLGLYLDWSAHAKLNYNKNVRILDRVSAAVSHARRPGECDEGRATDAMIAAVRREFSIWRLRDELRRLFPALGVTTMIAESHGQWTALVEGLFHHIAGFPITRPMPTSPVDASPEALAAKWDSEQWSADSLSAVRVYSSDAVFAGWAWSAEFRFNFTVRVNVRAQTIPRDQFRFA